MQEWDYKIIFSSIYNFLRSLCTVSIVAAPICIPTNSCVSVTQVLVCLIAHVGIFKSSCYIDVRWFPFDVQQCKLKFGSWSYGGWSLDLQMQEADISGYIPNGEWDLVGKPRNTGNLEGSCFITVLT